jgi:hypothetical protein
MGNRDLVLVVRHMVSRVGQGDLKLLVTVQIILDDVI